MLERFRTIRPRRAASIGVLLIAAGAAAPQARAACAPDGVQASGAVHRLCMPERWNGDLVVWAHGYVGFDEPVAIPEDHLVIDGVYLPDLVNGLGFAFATTSYSRNGLAILQGLADVVDVVDVFAAAHGAPRRAYLVGASEGGVITALAVERHADVFDGGLAACGPVGDFPRQINYWGDFRVVLDELFPGLIPGSAVQVPDDVIAAFDDVHLPRLMEATAADPDATAQLLDVTRAPIDPADPSTIAATIAQLAWYNVFATNDGVATLGGQPYHNKGRIYLGSDHDLLLNLRVARFAADPAAVVAMESYQTSGRPRVPIVTLHTTGDEVIPYWQERLYRRKVMEAGLGTLHVNIPISRWGHCNFKASEALLAFAVLIAKVGAEPLGGIEAALPDETARREFRALAAEHGLTPR